MWELLNILLEFLEGFGSLFLLNVIIVIVGLILVIVCIEFLFGVFLLYVGFYFFIESFVEVFIFGMVVLVLFEVKFEYVVVINFDCLV